ncbi:hypothetical protein ZWY2020_025722 [Hordeum vulgare]|nr:hypothetical protein ZWY2020_025722 [Hordeum vulgare]
MGLLSRTEEVAALVRLKVAAGPIRREFPPEMHSAFAYEMLQRVSCSFALGPELRNAVSAPSPPFPRPSTPDPLRSLESLRHSRPLILTLPAGVRLLPRARLGLLGSLPSMARACALTMAVQALRKEPLTVYGDGKQTRSFQYVSDLTSLASALTSSTKRRAVREEGMEALVAALERFVPVDELNYRDVTVYDRGCASLRQGSSREATLAYRAIGLLALTVGAATAHGVGAQGHPRKCSPSLRRRCTRRRPARRP